MAIGGRVLALLLVLCTIFSTAIQHHQHQVSWLQADPDIQRHQYSNVLACFDF
jgi:hypothetical protein